MAHCMKKVEFMALIANMSNPRLRTFRGSVYLRDGDSVAKEIEIYRASNMKEEGIISSMNKSTKFRNWMDAAK